MQVEEIDTAVDAPPREKFCILGTSPLIVNRPAARTASPLQRFHQSLYLVTSGDTTRVGLPTQMFKSAICSAAAAFFNGATASRIRRQVFVTGSVALLFGVPRLLASVVHGARGQTEVRTRAIFPEWACELEIARCPTMSEQMLSLLLAAAGSIEGVGDWRLERGRAFGGFKVVSQRDDDFSRIVSSMGQAAQDDAIEAPEPFDDATVELLRRQQWHA